MSDNPYQPPQTMTDLSDAGGADPKLDRTVIMLRQTKPWVRFISVMSFVGSAFMVLAGLLMIVAKPLGFGAAVARFDGGFGAVVGVVYIIMALFYIIPAVFLWRYADRIALFVREGSTGALASALEAQKSFWKFAGIVMLVVIAIYALIFVVAIVGGIVASM